VREVGGDDADFAADGEFRVIQFTPPGTGCSVIFGSKVTPVASGSAQGLYLIVASRSRRAASMSVRIGGPDAQHGSCRSFASFRDPDGNGWLMQEVTARLPGRRLTLRGSCDDQPAENYLAAANIPHTQATCGKKVFSSP
jgi:hypothetical protein